MRGRRVEVRVASPNPPLEYPRQPELSRAPTVSLRDRRRRPRTEPACREVRQQSGSREGLGRAVVRSAPQHRCCGDNEDQGAEVPGGKHDGKPGWEPQGRTTLRFSGRARTAAGDEHEVTN
jgi:hypothetical protein